MKTKAALELTVNKTARDMRTTEIAIRPRVPSIFRFVLIPNLSIATDVTVEDIMALEKMDALFNIVGVITTGDNPLETRWLRDGNALIKTDAVIKDATGTIPKLWESTFEQVKRSQSVRLTKVSSYNSQNS